MHAFIYIHTCIHTSSGSVFDRYYKERMMLARYLFVHFLYLLDVFKRVRLRFVGLLSGVVVYRESCNLIIWLFRENIMVYQQQYLPRRVRVVPGTLTVRERLSD